MPQACDYLPNSYKIDVWDAIEIVLRLPKLKGSTPYAQTFRTCICDIYEWLERFTILPSGVRTYEVTSVSRASLLEHLRHCEMVHVHQVSCSKGEVQEREQARVDAYALVYDRFRDNL